MPVQNRMYNSSPIRTNYLNFGDQEQDGTPSKKPAKGTPPPTFIHGSLCAAQVIFGISAVVGSIGLPAFHPLTFALVRESVASIILLSAAHVVSLRAGRANGLKSGSFKDFPKFLICGVGLFASQAFYIMGIKLSSAVAASVWQPTQPIFTAAACMVLGWEPYNMNRCIGIMIAFFGCAIMVLGGKDPAVGGGDADGGVMANLVGQVFFFLNCCGSSLYVLSSKAVIKTERYESVAVTAWSYATASVIMFVFAGVLSLSEGTSRFLCSDCGDNVWHVPPSAIPAMIWFIVMTSSLSYGLITWANKYASGTMVIGYTVTQPVASAIVIQTLVSFGLFEGCQKVASRMLHAGAGPRKACLDLPDKFTVIGAIGVFIGLMAIIYTEPKSEDQIANTDEEEEELLLEMADRSLFLDEEDDGNI